MSAAGSVAALGLKVHTGWAAVVAVAAPSSGPIVLARARLQIAWTFAEGAVFHAAQARPLEEARAHVQTSSTALGQRAREELAAFSAALQARVVAAGVVWGKPKPLPPLESIVKSHPLVHAAEADLYRRLYAEAAEAVLALAPIRVPAEELVSRAGAALQLDAAEITARLAALGKASGRPWTVDQREAALVAWLALASAAT